MYVIKHHNDQHYTAKVPNIIIYNVDKGNHNHQQEKKIKISRF